MKLSKGMKDMLYIWLGLLAYLVVCWALIHAFVTYWVLA